MSIYGSDLPLGVLALRFLDGHRQQLVRTDYETRWQCDCSEYRTIRPNTPRAYCRNTQRCGGLGE